MSKKRRKVKTRAEPDAVHDFLVGVIGGDLCIPVGYTPLSKNEEVIRCADKIADLVSNMTIMLMQNGENGDVRIRNEISKKIDISPNNNMGRKNFIYKIVKDMILTGNSVVLPDTTTGYIDNLIPLNASSLSFHDNGSDYIIKYKTNEFRSDEVLHFVLNPDDDDYYRGNGCLQMIKSAVMNLVQENATKTSFLKSKWKPSIIMSVESDAEELQRSETRRSILGSYTNDIERGEPWIIPAGEIDIKTIQPLTLQDLAIQDGITLDMKCIASAIGVPPFIVGVGEFNKDEYNNFISTRIMSIATIIQQELTKKILYSDKWYFKFNYKSLMQYDLSEKTTFVKDMVTSGMLSRNEGRNEFDYSPVDNEGMNDYNVLENYIPVDKLGDQKKLKGDDKDE